MTMKLGSFIGFLWLFLHLINGIYSQGIPTMLSRFQDFSQVDAIFVVDSGLPITVNFRCVLSGLSVTASKVNAILPIRSTGTAIGVVRFDVNSYQVLSLVQGRSLSAVQSAVSSIPSSGPNTQNRIDKGLNLAFRMFNRASRPSAYRLVILATDANNTVFDPEFSASDLESIGAEIFVLPITFSANLTLINILASAPKTQHRLAASACNYFNAINNS